MVWKLSYHSSAILHSSISSNLEEKWTCEVVMFSVEKDKPHQSPHRAQDLFLVMCMQAPDMLTPGLLCFSRLVHNIKVLR